MEHVIALAESEVSSIEVEGDTLHVRFSAASATRVADGVAGYLRGVMLVFQQAKGQGLSASCMGRLSAGRLVASGEVLRSIPVPYQSAEGSSPAVSAELDFRNGERVVIEAAWVAVRPNEPLVFHESYAC